MKPMSSRRNNPETSLCTDSHNEAPDKKSGRFQMNHSIHSADRMTHLKIVSLALAAGFSVAVFGLSAKTDDTVQTASVVKAGKPVMLSGSDVSEIR
jgi:hypothetical protein